MSQPKNFGFGDDERMARDEARRFLRENLPVDRLRALVAADHEAAYASEVQPLAWDRDLWKRIVDLGWTGLAVAPEHGGSGLALVAAAALAEEAGRAALPAPLVSTLVATELAKACSGAAAAATLERIAGGAAATVAICAETASWEGDDVGVSAAATAAGGLVLTGAAHFVQDARKSAILLVAAATGDGVAIAEVAADAPGVSIRPDRITDLTRDQAVVELASVEVAPQAILSRDGRRAVGDALAAMLVLVCADMCGAAEWQLQTTTEYARTRRQFDRPIGFFQAVKHPLVEMMVAVDRAKSITYAAACAVEHEPAQALRLARMAKAAASDAAKFVSGRSIQLHGGIGFTWECGIHIWAKRQQHNQFLFGDGSFHRARLADRY